jgi:drug/metabolite transporter (DMT)-like permease
MGKINIGRVIIAGLVAGIVSDILGFVVDGMLLAVRWADGMRRLGHNDFPPNAWIWFNVIGLAGGIALIWIYAAIRPRFGAGVKTAVCAGVAYWFVGCLLPNLGFMCATGLFSLHLAAMTTAGNLVEIVAGAIAGAALYKE